MEVTEVISEKRIDQRSPRKKANPGTVFDRLEQGASARRANVLRAKSAMMAKNPSSVPLEPEPESPNLNPVPLEGTLKRAVPSRIARVVASAILSAGAVVVRDESKAIDNSQPAYIRNAVVNDDSFEKVRPVFTTTPQIKDGRERYSQSKKTKL